ncbi:MAG: FAD-binding oxidoreductase [Actinomycetota bacterium]|nr:FAD-binding oxidoreductase [Actinomycetota bacterium]
MSDPMLVSENRPLDAGALRARLDGSLSVPEDPDWDDARKAWNLSVDQRPAAVVQAESPADVVAVVEFARANGLRIAPQGTGHMAGALEALSDTVLLKTSRMRGVEIDAENRRARVEAGVIWQEVADAAAEHGLAALAGSAWDVGVVGYSLGGGMGWLARRYGLSANSVLAVELVTADGRLVRADRDNEPDLFWAVRGGGGNFGIVTALELALYPHREVYAGVLFWPMERAAEILHAWREWIDTVPEELTSVGRLLRFPPIPEMPDALRGKAFVVVEAAYVGTEAEGAELLRPLRELGPEMDTVAMMPVERLSEVHMDPPGPAPGRADGMMLAELPAEAVEALLAAVGPDSASSLFSVEFRHLGGELARSSPEKGAVGALDAGFAVHTIGLAPTPEMVAVSQEQFRGVRAVLAPWQTERTYFNFTERRTEGRELYGELTYRRLREVKARYDPDELLFAAHPIRPASAA